MSRVELKTVDKDNIHIYDRLVQYYECEFSGITGKKPDNNALFSLDTEIGGSVKGFIGYVEEIPAGLAAVKENERLRFEICEFFVIPYFRKNKIGSEMAAVIWDRFPGFWEVKQIEGADYAVTFWRKAISSYTGGNYEEGIIVDPYWGRVTRQCFDNTI